MTFNFWFCMLTCCCSADLDWSFACFWLSTFVWISISRSLVIPSDDVALTHINPAGAARTKQNFSATAQREPSGARGRRLWGDPHHPATKTSFLPLPRRGSVEDNPPPCRVLQLWHWCDISVFGKDLQPANIFIYRLLCFKDLCCPKWPNLSLCKWSR